MEKIRPRIERRNHYISGMSIFLVLVVIFLWIFFTIYNDDTHLRINQTSNINETLLNFTNFTNFIWYNDTGLDVNNTRVVFIMQYSWFISVPLAFFLLLFVAMSVVGGCANMFCPIGFMKTNSKYFSCVPPDVPSDAAIDYPSVTIQIPVYTEDLEETISQPLLASIKCRDYYEGVIDVNILVSDDGIMKFKKVAENKESTQSERDAALERIEKRKSFYDKHDISYICRPPENRRGLFRKAGNLNFSMECCRIKEDYTCPEHIIQKTLCEIGCETIIGGDIKMGDYILLLDSDSGIPHNCLDRTLLEFIYDPKLGFTQHLTYPVKPKNTFWESFIAHFTTMIYQYSIFISAAGGNIAPLVGHNAVLNKKAIYDSFRKNQPSESNKMNEWELEDCIDNFSITGSDEQSEYGYPEIWSETNVSEDFKLFLDMVSAGYYGKYITFTGADFSEGISQCFDDELEKFRKYTYGTCEIMFNPIRDWLCCCTTGKECKTAFSSTIINFLKSSIDFSSKINLLSYLFTYIAMATGVFSAYLNYFIYGWYPESVLGLVLPTAIYIQVVFLFQVWGTMAYSINTSRYRKKFTLHTFWKDVKQSPIYFLFFGSIQYHLSKVVLTYMFCSYNISWGTTRKDDEKISRKEALRSTGKKYMDVFVIFTLTIVMIIVLCLPVIPGSWRITSAQAIVPLAIISAVNLTAPILLNPYITSEKIHRRVVRIKNNVKLTEVIEE